MKNTKHLNILASLAFATIFAGTGRLSASTCYVPSIAHPTIEDALLDAGCDTIVVAPGVYTFALPLIIDHAVTLKGAQAGTTGVGRTFGGPAESTLQGQIRIEAADVKLDGFSVTNSVSVSAAFAIVVKSAGDDAVITNNVIDTVTTSDTGSSGTAQGIYLEDGPDGVTISNNSIKNIISNRSAKGILLGANSAADAPQNTVITGNTISNVTSTTRGAYGILVGNPAFVSGGVTGLVIDDNVIGSLNGGGWVHAIGLEGDTPSVVVTNNEISNLTDSGPSDDNIGVFFESNLSFSTAEVHDNNFFLTLASYGIAVHPALTGGAVDGTCNWWNNATGPTIPSNAGGTGTRVSPGVTYSPWLNGPAPFGICVSVITPQSNVKKDGWKNLIRPNGTSFKNQGDAMQYQKTGK